MAVNSESEVSEMYRFINIADEINWDSKYIPNTAYTHRIILPILDFIEDSIKRITQDNGEMRAVVGVSGGIDSCLVSWLTANAMEKGLERDSIKEAKLTLNTYFGMSKDDLEYGRRFSRELIEIFPNLDITSQEMDLRPLMRQIDGLSERLVISTRRTKTYPGELATRIINLMTLEYADKTSHCSVDGTNATEIVLGEIVLGAGLECYPLSDFYKSQVFDIAETTKLPKYILDRNPINSTFGIDKVNSYFGQIPKGLDARSVYAVLDPVLYQLHRLKKTPEEVASKLGHSVQFVKNVQDRLTKQKCRRSPPFFNQKNKTTTLERTCKEIPNRKVKKVLADSFLV